MDNQEVKRGFLKPYHINGEAKTKEEIEKDYTIYMVFIFLGLCVISVAFVIVTILKS